MLEDLKTKNISLPNEFVSELLIEKLPESWTKYKQNLEESLASSSDGNNIINLAFHNFNKAENVNETKSGNVNEAKSIERNKNEIAIKGKKMEKMHSREQ